MSIRPPVLRLHNGLWTRTLRLSDIAQCRPCVTSKGLIYLAAIPEFVLADGSSVLFNGVQWQPEREHDAQQDCDALMWAIEEAREATTP
jgi:hypothetical protein